MVFFPAKPVTEIVTVPAAGSTPLTSPPTPRFCQSWRIWSVTAATTERVITRISSVAIDLPSSEAKPRTRIVSPTCKACNWIGVAFFRSFSPEARRRIRAVGWTLAIISAPESGAKVTVFPLMLLMVPRRFATGALPGAGCCCQATAGDTAENARRDRHSTSEYHDGHDRYAMTGHMPTL